MSERGTALIIVYSDATRDSRVQHQIRWLSDAGYDVDTIALGPHPSPSVRMHYPLLPQAKWVASKFGRVMNYAVLPNSLRFKFLVADRIDPGVRALIADGAYDLIVFEDQDFLPVLEISSIFTSKSGDSHVHLDLHEYREPTRPFLTIRRLFSDGYYRWRRAFIGNARVDSRTTVSSKIAELYHDDFGFPKPVIVRNAPAFELQTPSAVDPRNIRLVFHGMASWERGFPEILEAMNHLDARFTMTFMLTSNPHIVTRLRNAAERFGARVQFVAPVPVHDVSRALNKFDLEIIFFQPQKRNLHYSLPNKYFEAVQGRLGVIIGRSPMMAELVERYSNGAIVSGWSGVDLAATLNGLSAADVEVMKQNSDIAAKELNSENEGQVFLRAVSATTPEGAEPADGHAP